MRCWIGISQDDRNTSRWVTLLVWSDTLLGGHYPCTLAVKTLTRLQHGTHCVYRQSVVISLVRFWGKERGHYCWLHPCGNSSRAFIIWGANSPGMVRARAHVGLWPHGRWSTHTDPFSHHRHSSSRHPLTSTTILTTTNQSAMNPLYNRTLYNLGSGPMYSSR